MVDGNMYWRFFHNPVNPIGIFIPIVYHYDVDAAPDNAATGRVTGGGRVPEEWLDTLTAIPNEGFRFSHWHDGNTDNPHVITVTHDTTFRAFFVSDSVEDFELTVLANNDQYGNVSGGGTYNFGDEVTITASPYEGYRLVGWDDGDTGAARVVTVVGDTTYVAIFDSVPVGIADAERLAFTLSPNPVDGSLNITAGEGEYDMEIIDMRGVVVLRGSLRGPQSSYRGFRQVAT